MSEDFSQKVILANSYARIEKDETHDFPASGQYIEIDLGEQNLFSLEVGFLKEGTGQIVIAVDSTERDSILGQTNPKPFIDAVFPVGFLRKYDNKPGKKLYIKSSVSTVSDAVLITKKYWKV